MDLWASQVGGSVVKNLHANAGEKGDTGSIPGSGRSLEEGMAIHSSILTGKIPWTEEPDRLQSMGSQRVRGNLVTEQHHQSYLEYSWLK